MKNPRSTKTTKRIKMGDAADVTFEKVESGASLTYPKQCSALRKNEHCIIKNRAVKIVEMTTSKTGKHGHAKVHMVGIDIFTGKKYEDICPSTHNMSVPNIQRLEYQLCDIGSEGYLSLLNDDGIMRNDLKLPEGDLGQTLKKMFDADEEIAVVVVSAMGSEIISGHKKLSY